MNITNGTHYDDLYCRAAAGLLATCADPQESASRKAAYAFLTGLYRAVLDDPAACGFKPSPDLWFEPWEKQKGREADVRMIRDAYTKVGAPAAELLTAVEAGTVSVGGLRFPKAAVKRAALKRFALVGATIGTDGDDVLLTLPAGCAEGLRELAAIARENALLVKGEPMPGSALFFFQRVAFEPKSDWLAPCFDRLLQAEGRVLALTKALEQRGYRRVVSVEGVDATLDYVKHHGRKDEQIKQPWAERAHTGVRLSFEPLRLEPAFFWLRVPAYKTVLEHMDELPENVRGFLTDHTKRCDGCRFCVNTDRTGERPLSCIRVGKDVLCPMFPGFGFNWRSFSQALLQATLDTLDALDAHDGFVG